MVQAKQIRGPCPRIVSGQQTLFPWPMKNGPALPDLVSAASSPSRPEARKLPRLEVLPVPLDWNDRDGIAASRAVIISAFNNSQRYPAQRISEELQPATPPQYRQFIVVWHEGRLVGAGGIKSADWASNSHILYLSAVESRLRGRGIGRALVRARLDWIFERHNNGRILVSTLKPKRYRDMGFREISRKASDAPSLLLLEF